MNYRNNCRYKDEDYFRWFKEVFELCGSQCPTRQTMQKYQQVGKPTYESFKYRWGNWEKARKEAIEWGNEQIRMGSMSLKAVEVEAAIVPRQLRKEAVETGPVSKKLRSAIFDRDGWKCRKCGATVSKDNTVRLEVDHIIPRAKGGKTVESNLETLCLPCNRAKGIKVYERLEHTDHLIRGAVPRPILTPHPTCTYGQKN